MKKYRAAAEPALSDPKGSRTGPERRTAHSRQHRQTGPGPARLEIRPELRRCQDRDRRRDHGPSHGRGRPGLSDYQHSSAGLGRFAVLALIRDALRDQVGAGLGGIAGLASRANFLRAFRYLADLAAEAIFRSRAGAPALGHHEDNANILGDGDVPERVMA